MKIMPLNFSNPSKLFVWGYGLLCPSYGRKFYKMLVNTLNLKGDEHILDFGSGAGVLAKRIIKGLSEKGQLTCLDTSSVFLNKVRRKLRKYTNTNFLLGDIRNLQIDSNSFDIIVTSWVLHHLPAEDIKDVLKEFNKALKPNGRVLIIEYCREPHGISEEVLISLLNSNSLKVIYKYREKNTILIDSKRA